EVLSDRVVIKCYGPVSHDPQPPPPPSTTAAPERPGWTVWGSSPGQTANVGFVFLNKDFELVTGIKLIVYRLSDGAELATLYSESDGRLFVWNNVSSADRNVRVDIRFDNPDWSVLGFDPVPWHWAEAAAAFVLGFAAYRFIVAHFEPQPAPPTEPQAPPPRP